MARIAVIGAGAWGTALAIAFGRKGSHQVRLWAFEKEVCESIEARRTNDLFLPEAPIPATVEATNSLEHALEAAEIVVSVMPSHHTRRVYTSMKPYLTRDMVFVSATKGIENESLLRMSQVITEVLRDEFPPRLAVLSGPSFAREVAKGDPTAVAVASTDTSLARTIQDEFSDPTFRVYRNEDVIGVELGGALKNIVAIAAGVVDGLGLGHNTAAALITRGLAEMTRLCLACGGHTETMAGLAGLGDLVLTCTGGLSRNRTVGVELGKGRKLEDIISGMHGMVAEGVLTTNAAVGLARKTAVEMPITQQMHSILHDGRRPKDAIRELMTRPSTAEVAFLRT